MTISDRKKRAIDAYLKTAEKAEALADEIKQLIVTTAPEYKDVNFGHAGSMAHVCELLTEIKKFLSNEDY